MSNSVRNRITDAEKLARIPGGKLMILLGMKLEEEENQCYDLRWTVILGSQSRVVGVLDTAI